jgi:hypothetical protein
MTLRFATFANMREDAARLGADMIRAYKKLKLAA